MEFQSTIGHKKQKELFFKVSQKGSLAHAYALVGPENIGKTTFALELAKLLGADPIMDLQSFESEEGLTIKEAREIKNRLSLTPTGKLKVGVIANAERITLSAANALLKVLEEPPDRSAIFLVTSNLHALLPTISSRVQKVFFRLSSPDEINEALRNFSLEKENAKKITNLAKGRIGLAIRLAQDPELLEFHERTREFYKILKAPDDHTMRLQTAEKLSALETKDLRRFLHLAMLEWCEEADAKTIGMKLFAAWRDLDFNLNKKLSMDNLFLKAI